MNIGDKAPEVLGKDETGREVRLSDFKGQKLVLYFYPKDLTSGCTAEACSFRDHHDDLAKAGYAVVGVSVDDEKKHQQFKQKHELNFPLIADVDHQLVEAFGVWQEKSMYGRNTWAPCAPPSSSTKRVWWSRLSVRSKSRPRYTQNRYYE